VAIKNYRGIGDDVIPQLPLAFLERVYNTRLIECQQLSFEDFKTECLHRMSFRDTSGLAERAVLVIFVEPTEAARCREWFRECTTLLNAIHTDKGKELLVALQYLWSNDVLSSTLRLDLTLSALPRLDDQSKAKLCVILGETYPNDSWIETHLPRPQGASAVPENHEKSTQTSITLDRWYQPGTVAECRMCGLRPSKLPFLDRAVYKLPKLKFKWAQRCNACKYYTLKVGLIPNDAVVGARTSQSGSISENGQDSRTSKDSDEGPSRQPSGAN
jgi:hypothetical protein